MSRFGYESPWMNDDLRLFRESARRLIRDEFVPQQRRWREQHRPDDGAWIRAGAAGLLLPDVSDALGGGGGTFASEAVVIEELARATVPFGSTVQSVVAHYIVAYGSDAQKKSWLPRMARGELVAAIAMTEPEAGSDLQGIRTTARREDGCYVINGSKTFITNGSHAGVVCVAVRTDSRVAGPKSISLIMVETNNLHGFRAGRMLEKIGRQGQDTCELFFDDVRVPVSNLLGDGEGRGFFQMMEQLPYERLSVALSAIATAEEALAITIAHVKERMIAGKPMFELQNARFKLAECSAETLLCRVFADDCVRRFIDGTLDPATAAMAKYRLTECEGRVVDECVQLHGGYGYMEEYQIARMWADGRVQRIYSGTNEVMKEVIAWSL